MSIAVDVYRQSLHWCLKKPPRRWMRPSHTHTSLPVKTVHTHLKG